LNEKPWKDRSKYKQPQIHEDRIARLRRSPAEEPWKQKSDLVIPATVNQSGEAMVVQGFQISTIMRKWITNYLKDRPHNHRSTDENGTAGVPNDFIGPIELLAEKTGMHIRQVSRICNGELKTVQESQAEKLLIAIDESYRFSNGEIQVVPNPNWSNERWIRYMQEQGCY
jgi:predicted lipase